MTNPIRRCADAGRAGISTSFFEINYFFNIHELKVEVCSRNGRTVFTVQLPRLMIGEAEV